MLALPDCWLCCLDSSTIKKVWQVIFHHWVILVSGFSLQVEVGCMGYTWNWESEYLYPGNWERTSLFAGKWEMNYYWELGIKAKTVISWDLGNFLLIFWDLGKDHFIYWEMGINDYQELGNKTIISWEMLLLFHGKWDLTLGGYRYVSLLSTVKGIISRGNCKLKLFRSKSII